ncbi:MAG TPA: formyltransferase family protein [Candidatus Baltobacteraceae bacterium]
MVNLLVDLDDERFSFDALGQARRAIEAAEFQYERGPASDSLLAWLDDAFGGTWSSEAFAGNNVVAKVGNTYAGFATYAPQGLRFSWLRGYGARDGVGIFGPFGVDPQFRGSAIGPNLLIAALASLREAGYAQALIPAVGEEKLVEYYVKRSGARVVERFEKAQWQRRKWRTTVFASGNGSNFQAVLDAVASGRLPLDVTALVTNNASAYAIERARASHVPSILTLPWNRASVTRAEYDALLHAEVVRSEPDLVLLLGWMHLLDAGFVAQFSEMINIHPAFLPLDQSRDRVGVPGGGDIAAYRGARAVRDALADGSSWIGASSHQVTLDADRGPVLVRKPLAVVPGEEEASVIERLHPIEHRVLTGGIMRWVFER